MKIFLVVVSKGICLTAIAALLLCCRSVSGAAGDDYEMSLEEVIKDCQKYSKQVDRMTLLWWIPEEFWRLAVSQDPTVTEEGIEEFLSVLRPYTIVVAVDGKIGAFGGLTYTPEEELFSMIRIQDSEGISYAPLYGDEVDPNVENFMAMLKPIFSNMAGAMGENMNFFVFPAETDDGGKIADPGSEGTFKVLIGDEEFRWKLPLGSLLPPKVCPRCGEKLSGAYKYCPYDGVKLK